MIRLLDAAISLRLVERRGATRYGLGPLGAVLARNPSLTAMIRHHRHLYVDLTDPVALYRGDTNATQLAKYWAYAGAEKPSTLNDDEVGPYSTLMALSQPLVAEEVLDAVPLVPFSSLLDVGGGEGAFIAAVAARSPDVKIALFDLPAVAERAKARLSKLGLDHKAQCFGGDFLVDPMPPGHDVVTLVRVILDHDDSNALTILRAARRALGPGGMLILAEPMADTPGAEVMGAAYFGTYLMAMGRGRARTRNQIKALLTRAGFSSVNFYTGGRVLRTGIAVAKP
jgi:demethylspheroidene O-methyltransferase